MCCFSELSTGTGGFRVFGKKERLAILLSFQLFYIMLEKLTKTTRIIFPADKNGEFGQILWYTRSASGLGSVPIKM